MELQSFFRAHPKAALGFSGGVDSAYLLWAGVTAGADLQAYFVKTAFQPAFELEDAKKIANQLGANLTVIEKNILSDTAVQPNPPDRCYHCKRSIFGAIAAQASADGYPLLLDGSNADDDPDRRPGMRALTELAVRSPLREAGLTKAEIRRRSKEAGLFTHDKPAYACLATRFPTRHPFTLEALQQVEYGETALFQLGFTDFRLRITQEGAKLQFPESQLPRAVALRNEIRAALQTNFPVITLDLTGR